MLCHDINAVTKSSTHIDIVMGSSAADIIWYEPLSQKYARLNKNVSHSPDLSEPLNGEDDGKGRV